MGIWFLFVTIFSFYCHDCEVLLILTLLSSRSVIKLIKRRKDPWWKRAADIVCWWDVLISFEYKFKEIGWPFRKPPGNTEYPSLSQTSRLRETLCLDSFFYLIIFKQTYFVDEIKGPDLFVFIWSTNKLLFCALSSRWTVLNVFFLNLFISLQPSNERQSDVYSFTVWSTCRMIGMKCLKL